MRHSEENIWAIILMVYLFSPVTHNGCQVDNKQRYTEVYFFNKAQYETILNLINAKLETI